ncbi:MAG: pterin-binding protein [Chloroflexi bacterium]|nr:pterin-binding protein [Chloroflexota bacterium]
METRVSSVTQEVLISHGRPTVLIGERLNPTGKKKLTATLQEGDLGFLQKEALSQVQAGADILDINVGVPGLDEVALLPQAIQTVINAVDVPLCLDSRNPKALETALKVYPGKAIINSVNGEQRSMERVLPLVKEYGTAVIALTIDDEGIPKEAGRRVAIACKIIERAEALGILREDVIIDPLAMTVGADSRAGLVVLETIRRIKAELGANITLGASNISFGLPDRALLNSTFLTIAIAAGVTCPIVDAAKVRPAILAADLILGRDSYAKRYIGAYRQRQRP